MTAISRAMQLLNTPVGKYSSRIARLFWTSIVRLCYYGVMNHARNHGLYSQVLTPEQKERMKAAASVRTLDEENALIMFIRFGVYELKRKTNPVPGLCLTQGIRFGRIRL
jgi:hypothetical protein